MEPFPLECTTCKAKLKVRDAAMVGQIIACPKCGSMVLVPAPPSESRGPEPENPQTGSAPEVLESFNAPAAGGDSPEPTVEGEAGTLAQPVPSATPNPKVESPDAVAATSASPETPESLGSAAIPAAPPPLDWAQSEQPWRAWVMLLGGGATGLLLAVAAFGYLISRSAEAPRDIASRSDVSTGDSRSPSPPPVEPGSNPPEAEPHDPPPETSEPENSAGRETIVESGTVPEVSPPSHEATPGEEPARDLPAPVDPESPRDPPSVAPEGFTPREAEANPPANSDPLGLFADLFGDPGFQLNEEAGDSEEQNPDVTAEIEAALVENREPEFPRPQPREVDVAARLSDPLAGIDFRGIPLADLVQTLADLSTIPITIDVDALAQLGRSPESPVTVQLRETTTGEALNTALAPLGLEARIVDRQVLITRPPPRDGYRKVRFQVGDLATDRGALEELAQTTRGLIAPDSWEEAGGRGRLSVEADALVVENHEAAIYQLLLLCEKLRTARGVPVRSNFPREHLAVKTRVERAAPLLRAPVNLHFLRPTRWQEIFDRLRAETGLRVLVDWLAVGEEGWNPDAEAQFSADDAPLGESLAVMVEKLGLAYRVVDSRTVEITTAQVLRTRHDLEVVPVGDLSEGGEEVVERLLAALGEAADDTVLQFDAESGCLLASAPQPAIRRVLELLETWRAENGTP